jgi:exopolysaccharide biosynthesis polyprenyl glycosylphosphotransferase
MVIRKSTLSEWRSIIEACAITAIFEYIVWPQLTDASHGNGMRLFGFLTLTAFALSFGGRTLARRVACASSPDERCLIVGGSEQSGPLADRIGSLEGVELVGSVDASALVASAGDLRSLVEQLRVHRIVIVPDAKITDAATLELVRSAKYIGVRVSLFPNLLAAVGGCTVFDDLEGITVLGVPRFGLSRSSRAMKRTLDIAGASLGLVVCAPLFLVLAVLIRLDSPGPILFRQIRVGRDDQHFKMVKFRSMVVGAEAMRAHLLDRNQAGQGLFKITDDPRVTRVGRWLRRSHLDELPQLWNVLRGEMSLVGPRPLIVEEDQLIAGGDRYRLHLTPGMTGPWQIKGPIDTPLAEMAKLDYMYISNWSLGQDIDIMLRTAGRVLRRSGH